MVFCIALLGQNSDKNYLNYYAAVPGEKMRMFIGNPGKIFLLYKLIQNFNYFSVNFKYRSGTVNSKSFVGKVLLRIKWKFELNSTL